MPETTPSPSLAELVSENGGARGVPIELISVSKRYGGSPDAAVDDLTMTIPAGEIVVFLGPSGCGKTTTMRMINRLIEPTSGRILIGGLDARAQKPDELRRHIGYVIQQAGLFPHMTVAANIAQVPQMLGWDRQRIRARVDELLELVGLDPVQYRDRYPRQLSGGQQQRVGVARALAADPPVLLMDEPFGALDPITRESLQDELLRLQEELSKTIVFVTHDVDEALKLGDRIAILDKGSRIVQYATAEEILTNPAGSYVEQFIGGESSMRLLKLTRVSDVALEQAVRARATDDAADLRRRMAEEGGDCAIVLDERQRPLRWVSAAALEGASGPVGELPGGEEDRIDTVISGRSTLQEAVEALLNAEQELVPVVGKRRHYTGVVTLATVQQAIAEIKERERRLRRERVAAGQSAVSVAAEPAPAAVVPDATGRDGGDTA
ncbi:betaine/proline/choline family ABC transporter ATP-binding protein [Marinactinospora thermotolerans]|uniref:ABC-type quaternary amine transporter n=1 Tax=Marinactinospora thermotolerans DSM 45154 TaxID=1122192 RepID=A0A1T4T802_9ACTN|nr:ABC transporter ATP-binding protein [Marinactinospora thermotolerans]SKA36604.1 osmoprotectant transport system ATP-binding protein [Marinactinospora thermotolerans DSM 45154]